jgi:hypothetical protein
MTAALIGSAVALTAYALGYWTGRRTAECHELHWVPTPPTDDPDCPIGHIMLASGGRRIDLAVMNVAIDATRQRDRYRLAWLSARRRRTQPTRELMRTLETISGAIDDYTANRPTEDVIGEIGQAVDQAMAKWRRDA